VRVVRNRMVIELPDNVLFDSGAAELKPEGQATLIEIVQVLRSIEGRQFQVAGHTDNVPIRSRRFPSNWELSGARAVTVARFMIDQGMPSDRISAAGYADTQAIETNDTDEGRQRNRRIEIALVPNLDELPDLSSLSNMSQ
jgi:chemotaxis protein MotB